MNSISAIRPDGVMVGAFLVNNNFSASEKQTLPIAAWLRLALIFALLCFIILFALIGS